MVLDCGYRVFDYETNEVTSIKINIKIEIYKREAICKKIYLERLGYRNVDYSKVVRRFF